MSKKSRSSRLLAAGILAATALVVASSGLPLLAQQYVGSLVMHPQSDKVEPALLEKLDLQSQRALAQGQELPSYRVIVNLLPVESARNLERAFQSSVLEQRMRANITALQDKVLRHVENRAPGRLLVLNRYQSTYGFSAVVDAEVVDALIEQLEVTFVEEMQIYELMDSESHPLTNTDLAHAAGFTGQGVTIAIIDDGIDHDHAAFGGQSAFPNAKILGGRDFADNDSDPRIDCTSQSHGTSVTGVAAGNGGGVLGTAPDATIVFLKIQSASICGSNSLNGDIPGAIDWAVTNRNTFGIKVISMSLGTSSTFSSPCSGIAEASALNAAQSAGMVTLIASGNSADAFGISSPACHPAAVSVGAVYDANIGSANFGICLDSTTFADKVTCYSNSDTFLDMLAPSHCAFTATAGGGTTSCFGGTSSATPFAAGVVATLFEKDPGLSRSGAIGAITSTGVSINDPRNGISKPRVDTMAALDSLGGGGGGPGPCSGCIDWSTTSTVSYSNQDNTSVGSVSVQDGGATLALVGNRWRRTTQTFTVTADTVIEFDFMSTSQGEIHGIGFDEDDTLSNNTRIFQIFGTQNWGGAFQNAVQYTSGDLGSFVTFQIRVGDFYVGSGMRLVLVNDKDSGSQTNTSSFRDVRIFEDTGGGGGGACALDDDFESGAAGWVNSGLSTCSTGAYVLATPTQQTSVVVTQVGGDHTTGSGNAIFTATNTSAGNADVDGGNCVLESPTWSVSEASDLSVWYFHGQRDTSDDPGGDFFLLEISTNGGSSYTPLVSIGDTRTTAAWTEATRTIAAGSSVKLRLQVSDGAGPGDIIEGGIDDLSICPQP